MPLRCQRSDPCARRCLARPRSGKPLGGVENCDATTERARAGRLPRRIARAARGRAGTRDTRGAAQPVARLRGVYSLRQTLRDAADMALAPVVQERVAGIREHRPWPMPARSWVMAQSWIDLLFAHWSVPPERLLPVVPPQLTLDTREGRAWIAVTPFEVRNLRLRPTMPVPLLSSFPELNVRTYVVFGGKPGIYFFSLDAGSAPAVAAARRAYRLPYFKAQASIRREAPWIHYVSERSGPESDVPPAAFAARYRGIGAPAPPSGDSLEHWLTERYCLYTLDERQRVLRAEIHHPPWPLQPAEAEVDINTMTAQIGLELGGEPLLHYSSRQDVVFWTLE